jgi:hypothetical protein
VGGRYAGEYSESTLLAVGGAEDVTVEREVDQEEADWSEPEKWKLR